MDIIVIGSLAYDRFIKIEGLLSSLFTGDRYPPIDAGFHARDIAERFGGNAGNIAYALSQFGRKPVILSSVGKDNHNYFRWLADNRIGTVGIRIVEQEVTASAYVIADKEFNRITAFVPGAMEYPSSFDFGKIRAEVTLAVISAGNLTDIKNYCRSLKNHGIPYIFNPGQSLSRWKGDELVPCVQGAAVVVVNEYELAIITEKTGLNRKALAGPGRVLIVTLAEKGSVVCTGDYETVIPAVRPEKLVDSHGAGDAFTGGLANGIFEGRTMLESTMMATVCASFSLEHLGTQKFSFSREEFDGRLGRLKLEMSNK